jgi:hypothetical protein
LTSIKYDDVSIEVFENYEQKDSTDKKIKKAFGYIDTGAADINMPNDMFAKLMVEW